MQIRSKRYLTFFFFLRITALIMITGCSEYIVGSLTRAIYPHDLNSTTVVQQFHTDDPSSQIVFIGYQQTWSDGQDIVRVQDEFVKRPGATIEAEVRDWINGHTRRHWRWVEGLRNEQQRQSYYTPGVAQAIQYHLLVYLDSQPDVLVARGDWDSYTDKIRVQVFRASDFPTPE